MPTSRRDRQHYEKNWKGFQDHRTRSDCHGYIQPRGHASVELAHAGALRIAHHHLLAGIGSTGPEQSPVRRISRAAPFWWPLAASHDGAMGTDDAGRTREIPPGHARPLWPLPVGSRTKRVIHETTRRQHELLGAQRLHGFDTGSTPRGHKTGQSSRGSKNRYRKQERRRIINLHSV